MANVNPFEYKFPDETAPKDVIDLFVPVFSDYFSVPEIGHTFINGARGCGKSMMFRFMRPDCQVLVSADGDTLEHPRNIKELDYIGLYIPIKKGNLDKTDIRIIDNKHGEALLNEHYMVLFFAIKIFDELSKITYQPNPSDFGSVLAFYNNIFSEILIDSGYEETFVQIESDGSSIQSIFQTIVKLLKKSQKKFDKEYIQKLIGAKGTLPYNGPLFLYNDFLFDTLKELKNVSIFSQRPFYLLVDDADNLNIIQQKILNSWVAQRTTNTVSIKISTQLKYSTFRTINDSRIDTPHDYSVVNINEIYTSKKGLYLDRVKNMVERRLAKFNYKNSPEKYFPEDVKQKQKIKALFAKYEKENGYDFAYRYSVPDFIKDLGGNRYTFSYAGFEQLVNISSGNLRDFINFASKMYVFQKASNVQMKPVNFIEASVQDKIIKEASDSFIFGEFDALVRDKENDKNKLIKLRNLLLGLGGLFKIIMISEASERRVFSVALNDEPDDELKEILEIGIQYNYFHKSLIGNKYGTGKSRLFILNRMLAPHFILDPSSFAGYKFMDSAKLKIAMDDHEKFVSMYKRSLFNKMKTDSKQKDIFDSEP